MSKNPKTNLKKSKSFMYKTILIFFALIIIGVLQLFQTSFVNWFFKGVETDNLISIGKNSSLINEKFWFVELIHQFFGQQIPLPKIKIIFYSIISIILLIIGLFYWFINDKFFKFIFVLILIGGASNLISWIRTDGKVVDYLTFKLFVKTFFFNIEDIFVMLGVIMAIVYLPIWAFLQGRNSSPSITPPTHIAKPISKS